MLLPFIGRSLIYLLLRFNFLYVLLYVLLINNNSMSTLPGGDETMLHSVHIVGIRRLAISNSPVLIC